MSRNRLKPAIEKITSQAISPRAAAELSLALLIDDDSHRIYCPTQESQSSSCWLLSPFVRRAGWLNPHTWYTIHIITITSSQQSSPPHIAPAYQPGWRGEIPNPLSQTQCVYRVCLLDGVCNSSACSRCDLLPAIWTCACLTACLLEH